MSYKEEGPQVL